MERQSAGGAKVLAAPKCWRGEVLAADGYFSVSVP